MHPCIDFHVILYNIIQLLTCHHATYDGIKLLTSAILFHHFEQMRVLCLAVKAC